MKINIKRYFLSLAAVLFMVGCHEAVEPEAIDVNYSSFEETNPELYARYMQALREYKAGSHKAVFVTMTVPENGAATTHRTQHFTAIPDSVDFIVVNPVPAVLCQTLVDEIRKVHEKGTRILFNIDLQTFENDWTQVLKEDPTLSEDDALAYLGGRVGEQIALVDRWGYDGFIFTYTGKAVGSIQDEALAVYTARQEALFAPIRAWHEAHPSHALVFRGFTGAVTEANMPLLDECAYIILPTNDVKTLDEMSFSALTRSQRCRRAGRPSDRDGPDHPSRRRQEGVRLYRHGRCLRRYGRGDRGLGRMGDAPLAGPYPCGAADRGCPVRLLQPRQGVGQDPRGDRHYEPLHLKTDSHEIQ